MEVDATELLGGFPASGMGHTIVCVCGACVWCVCVVCVHVVLACMRVIGIHGIVSQCQKRPSIVSKET